MSHSDGRALAQTHNMLVSVWHSDGPETVHGLVQNMSRDEMEQLIMAHVGADAATR